MFWLAVFRHCTRAECAKYLNWAHTWVPNSRNVMPWSRRCLLTLHGCGYGVSPIVDIGSYRGSGGCLLLLRGSSLFGIILRFGGFEEWEYTSGQPLAVGEHDFYDSPDRIAILDRYHSDRNLIPRLQGLVG